MKTKRKIKDKVYIITFIDKKTKIHKNRYVLKSQNAKQVKEDAIKVFMSKFIKEKPNLKNYIIEVKKSKL